jgi:hypothetical protein
MDTSENINFLTVHNSDVNGSSDGAAVIAENTEFEVAAAYADDDIIAYVDGVSSGSSAGAIPLGDTMTTLRIGNRLSDSYFDGHIRELRYYNVRKVNQYLDDLSSGLIGGSDSVWVSTGSFSIIGQTGTDTTVTWTAPSLRRSGPGWSGCNHIRAYQSSSCSSGSQ